MKVMMRVVFFSLTHAGGIWEEEASLEKTLSLDQPVGKSVGHFLMNNCCGRAQLTMGGATPGQTVLGYKGIQAEQALENKSVNRIPLWFLHETLPSLPSVMDCDPDVQTQ